MPNNISFNFDLFRPNSNIIELYYDRKKLLKDGKFHSIFLVVKNINAMLFEVDGEFRYLQELISSLISEFKKSSISQEKLEKLPLYLENAKSFNSLLQWIRSVYENFPGFNIGLLLQIEDFVKNEYNPLEKVLFNFLEEAKNKNAFYFYINFLTKDSQYLSLVEQLEEFFQSDCIEEQAITFVKTANSLLLEIQRELF
jgi:predicted AlkP superfamily pyrophosphatase or phosphodiesterase